MCFGSVLAWRRRPSCRRSVHRQCLHSSTHSCAIDDDCPCPWMTWVEEDRRASPHRMTFDSAAWACNCRLVTWVERRRQRHSCIPSRRRRWRVQSAGRRTGRASMRNWRVLTLSLRVRAPSYRGSNRRLRGKNRAGAWWRARSRQSIEFGQIGTICRRPCLHQRDEPRSYIMWGSAADPGVVMEPPLTRQTWQAESTTRQRFLPQPARSSSSDLRQQRHECYPK